MADENEVPLEQATETVQPSAAPDAASARDSLINAANATSPPPAPPAAFDFQGALAARGINLPEGTDPNQAVDALLERYQRYAELERQHQEAAYYAGQYQQVAGELPAFQAWKQQQAAAQAKPAEAPKSLTDKLTEYWGRPKVSDATAKLYRLGAFGYDHETGRWLPKQGVQGVTPQMIEEINQYGPWRQEATSKLIDNLPQTQAEMFEKFLPEAVQPLIEKAINNFAQQQARQQYIERNFGTFYQTDNGQPVLQNGQPVPSQVGLAIQNTMQALEQSGVKPEFTLNMATQLVTQQLQLQHFQQQLAQYGQANGQPAQPPTQPVERPNEKWLNRAVQTASANGHAPQPAIPATRLGAKDFLLRSALQQAN